MKLVDLTARITRLDQLARVLAKEVTFGRDSDDPLLYAEEKTYLNAILDALAGVQGARSTLARARQRLENKWGNDWPPQRPRDPGR
jgi:hypothetical protein